MTISAQKSFKGTDVSPMAAMKTRIKRVYEQPDKHDGRRILVERYSYKINESSRLVELPLSGGDFRSLADR